MKKVVFPLILCLSLLFISGCSHPLSKEARLSVDPNAYFDLAKEHPGAYKGKTFLLGGSILNNRSEEGGSVIEVLSYDLDSLDRPTKPNEKNGRFLAQSNKFLDPALYQNDRLVTLTGTLTGEEKHTLNGADYNYLVFEVGEIYLWPREADRYLRDRYYNYPYPYYRYDPWYYPYYPYYPYFPHRRYPYYRHR